MGQRATGRLTLSTLSPTGFGPGVSCSSTCLQSLGLRPESAPGLLRPDHAAKLGDVAKANGALGGQWWGVLRRERA